MAKKKTQTEYPENKGKALELALSIINKEYGSTAALGDFNNLAQIDRISTGSPALDKVTGGGYPRGRIVELYGPESCIYRDSFLQYEVYSADDKERINHKGGTISRLYERFHNVRTDDTPNQGCHLQTKKAVKYYIRSVNDEGSIIRNEVLDVVKTGEKLCFKIATKEGPSIIATPEHRFLTPEGYKPLAELNTGDTVFIHNNTRRKGRKYLPNRPEVSVKYHPEWSTKIVSCKKTNCDYLYYRGQRSRASYEAFLNEMSLENYLSALNTWSKEEIIKLKFLPKDLHVHHLDENFTNNEITNLKLISPKEHGQLHAHDRIANLSFVMVPTEIVWKEEVGPRETYDLKCAFPYNNYIAEGIVVHNSGKTTATLCAIAECQKQGGTCVFIDAEHSLDQAYAVQLGVKLDELIVSQPDNGEDALNIVETFAKSGAVDLIVVDSVAALIPREEQEGSIGDQHVGRQARLMSQALRKLPSVLKKTNTLLIFINQIRMKIGVMFGNPETVPGGNALKFFSSQRLEIRRGAILKDDELPIGIVANVKVVKNKVGRPYQSAEIHIIFGKGIDWVKDLVDLGVEANIIQKSGAWYKYNEENIGQGMTGISSYMEKNPEFVSMLKEKLGL